VLNWIFLALIASAVIAASHLGLMKEVTAATANSAKTAVDIAIGLIGQMALWLGLMRVLEEAGMLKSLARALRPVMTRLFPGVPADHPAMSAMILNLAANMLGLSNAATPFGLRAMVELDKLNDRKGVATDAMALFLAINTSGVAVIATMAVATRATMGAQNITGIIAPSVLATSCSTIAAIIVAKLLEKRRTFAPERYPASTAQNEAAPPTETPVAAPETDAQKTTPLHLAVIALIFAAVVWGLVRSFDRPNSPSGFEVVRDLLESWFLPLLILAIAMVGFGRRVKVYEVLVDGAKQGFQIAVTIIPFMVAILVAVGMFRASGAMDMLVGALSPIANLIGYPPEVLPMAFIRPLSGSGALAVMTEIMKTHGPDSFVGFLSCVIYGSTETTFYVLAVYYGAVQVRFTRHTVIACLAADFVGALTSLPFARLFF
jgi:spore maturation protein SpmA